jgi:hypothetical protein
MQWKGGNDIAAGEQDGLEACLENEVFAGGMQWARTRGVVLGGRAECRADAIRPYN